LLGLVGTTLALSVLLWYTRRKVKGLEQKLASASQAEAVQRAISLSLREQVHAANLERAKRHLAEQANDLAAAEKAKANAADAAAYLADSAAKLRR